MTDGQSERSRRTRVLVPTLAVLTLLLGAGGVAAATLATRSPGPADIPVIESRRPVDAPSTAGAPPGVDTSEPATAPGAGTGSEGSSSLSAGAAGDGSRPADNADAESADPDEGHDGEDHEVVLPPVRDETSGESDTDSGDAESHQDEQNRESSPKPEGAAHGD